jgi:hypothetical protein
VDQNIKTELIAFCNRLLEAERAGVQALSDISSKVQDKDQKKSLFRIYIHNLDFSSQNG